MTAHTSGSITAYETEKWVRDVLAVTSDQISLATIKSQVKTRMHKRFLQLDVKAFIATLDRLTSAKIITKTGHGTTRKHAYNHHLAAQQQPITVDGLTADQPTTYRMEDAFLARDPQERAPTPSMYRGHDWIGQGTPIKQAGHAFWTHPQATREGCQDAFKCPSRISNKLVTWTGGYIGQGIKHG